MAQRWMRVIGISLALGGIGTLWAITTHEGHIAMLAIGSLLAICGGVGLIIGSYD